MIYKLTNIRDKLSFLLSQLKKICVKHINHIPQKIENIIVGTNKLPFYIGGDTLYEISDDDLRGVTTIYDSMFYQHDNITKIQLPDSVTEISDVAFYDCSNLTEIILSKNLTDVGIQVFGNTRITNLTIPKNLQYFNHRNGAGFLSDVRKLETVIFEDGMESIGNYACYYCTSLTSVTIPDSVTTIGDHAFEYCTSLTSVTIPDSVTTIGDHAFASCYNLTSITIPDSVTTIAYYAFGDCNGFTSITIPDSVTTIGGCAFQYCDNLKNIYFKSTTPPSLGDIRAFPTFITIHVPIGSGDVYRNATNWSSFASKIVEDPEL